MTAPKPTIEAPRLGEPYLLTPGPLTTSFSVKEAMLCDWGSWDEDFRAMTRDMRARLLALLGAGGGFYIPLDHAQPQGVSHLTRQLCLAGSGLALDQKRAL